MSRKVLILANYFGTVYKFRKELIEELINLGYEVIVSVPYRQEVEKIRNMGVKIIETDIDRKSINPFKDIKLYFNYKKILKKERPDIVITYTIKPNVYGGIACSKNIPYIANITGLGSSYYNGGLVLKIVKILYKFGLKNAKYVMFENSTNARQLVQDKTIKKEQVVVMNGAGVNLKQFEFSEMPSDDIIKFLFVGRIMKEKGVDELFYAIKKIKQEYKDKVQFSFVGWFEDDYEITVCELERNDFIKFYGYQDNVIPYMKDCHCVILPSYHEGMANVLLEGAAIGRGIITTDIPGCRESILDGVSGLKCKVKDNEDLYDKIKKFVDLTFEEKVEMGKAGRKHMEDVFDKNKVVRETVEVIER